MIVGSGRYAIAMRLLDATAICEALDGAEIHLSLPLPIVKSQGRSRYPGVCSCHLQSLHRPCNRHQPKLSSSSRRRRSRSHESRASGLSSFLPPRPFPHISPHQFSPPSLAHPLRPPTKSSSACMAGIGGNVAASRASWASCAAAAQ